MAPTGEEASETRATSVAAPAARRARGSSLPLPAPADPTVESIDTAPTELALESQAGARTGSRPGRAGLSAPPTGHTTATTPLEAMHVDEWERTRLFCRLCLVIDFAGIAVTPLVGGVFHAKLLMLGGLLVAGATMLAALRVLRTPQEYTVRRMFVVALSLAIAVQSGIYFYGVFSPAPALVLLGIYFYSKSASRGATSFVYALCAGFQGLLSALIIAGAIRDHGLISGAGLSMTEQIVVQLLIQLLFLISYLIARGSRRTQLTAMTQLEAAMRQVAVRDALLNEAQGDLRRALRLGDHGRHSGEIVGSYELGVLIGRGGMGEVYEACHIETAEPAAVKLLHPSALANENQLGRFLREIEAIAMLDVDEVVRVLQYGNRPDGVPYLVMEKLEGKDLAAHLRDQRRLSGRRVVELVHQAGRGLAAAWDVGIVHRDIKPQNLFRAEGRGRHTWKILDFGVSKLATTSGTLTRGHVVGTPGYMAPEQARGEDVDYRADLYALGVIAYRSLTGQPAFSAKDVPATMYEVVYGMPHRPSSIVELPEDVDLALAVALAKNPAARFSDPDALAEALERAIDGTLPDPIRRRAIKLLVGEPWKGD